MEGIEYKGLIQGAHRGYRVYRVLCRLYKGGYMAI